MSDGTSGYRIHIYTAAGAVAAELAGEMTGGAMPATGTVAA
jgi:hypothetical protein